MSQPSQNNYLYSYNITLVFLYNLKGKIECFIIKMSQKPPNNVLELFDKKGLIKICAPMVRYSKLQFRNLVKKYDCDLVFTPMILADSFCKSINARNNEFTTNLLDTPLITQFAANTVHDFVGASYLVAPFCDGVDLNCGCPQKWAKEMNLGCELLKNPQTIFELVRGCRNMIPKPFTVSVKTRIQKDSKKTVEICRQLEKSGVSFLSIHARTPSNNVGPIDEEALKMVVENVQIPVVGNGGLTTLEGCCKLQETTGVRGVMVANGILTNPEIFSGATITSLECVQDWLDICFNSTFNTESYEQIFNDNYDKINKNQTVYGTIPEKPFNLTFQCFHHHLVFMLEKVLTRRQKQIFNNLKTFQTVLEFLELYFNLKPRLFSREDFLQSVSLNLDYNRRDVVYNDLKPSIDKYEMLDITDYDPDKSEGKYFRNKLEEENSTDCDWSSIFIEND